MVSVSKLSSKYCLQLQIDTLSTFSTNARTRHECVRHEDDVLQRLVSALRPSQSARTMAAEKGIGRLSMDYSLAEKQAVHEAFEAVLDEFDAAGREPDRWEEDCLSQSLSAMTCGLYRLAAAHLSFCKTPLVARSPAGVLHLNSTPQKLTIEHLRRGLSQIRAFPSESE